MNSPTHVVACAVTKSGPIIHIEDARPDQRYVCAECEGPMLVIKAGGRAHHFKHMSGPKFLPRNCDPARAAETQAVRIIMDAHAKARQAGGEYRATFNCPECSNPIRALNLAACALNQTEPAKVELTNPAAPTIIIEATHRFIPGYNPKPPKGAAYIYVYAAWESLLAMRDGLDCSRADGAGMWCSRCAAPVPDWRDELARRAKARDALSVKAQAALAFLNAEPADPDFEAWPYAAGASLALAKRLTALGFKQHSNTQKPWLFSADAAGTRLHVDMEHANARVYCYGDEQPAYKLHAIEETARRTLRESGAQVAPGGGAHRDCRCQWHDAEGRHYSRAPAAPVISAAPAQTPARAATEPATAAR